MTVVVAISLAFLALAGVLGVVRIAGRRSLGDRAVVFDMLTSAITCALLVWAASKVDGLNLDLAVILGLLGFVTSVTVARFIETRSEEES
ncbi:MAG: monovalent cation/H+ antiporter complex subunit F [Ilumatobacteraceae bacterium]